MTLWPPPSQGSGPISILFVDDEPKVLTGLQRLLRSMRTQWSMRFASSGADALAMLAAEPADVVVSDRMMPGIDGLQLLAEVERGYPWTARIMLSGQCDHEDAIRAVGPPQLFLAKPCDYEQLIAAIQRSCRLRAVLATPELVRAAAQLPALPSRPRVYTELTAALRSPERIRTAGGVLDADPALAARVIDAANAPSLTGGAPIATAQQVIDRLGTELARTLVLACSVALQLEQPAVTKRLAVLWSHATRTASVARAIARDLGLGRRGADQAFSAGLLHDIGQAILAVLAADRYHRAERYAEQTGVGGCAAERAEIGASHPEIGAHLLALWGVPDAIVEAVAFHHAPGLAGEPQPDLVAAIHAAGAIASDDDPTDRADRGYLERAGILARFDGWTAGFRTQGDHGGRQ